MPARPASAALLRHVILEDDTSDSVEMERVCFAIPTLKSGRALCLPTPYLQEDNGRLELDLALKADQEAFDVTNRALSGQIDKPFLNTLFGKDSFESVSGYAKIRAIYGRTSLTYTPAHVIGAYKLTNPSLPEVHVAAENESVVRLEQNLIFRGSKRGEWDYLLAPAVTYHHRDLAYLDTDLLTTAVEKVKDLIQKKSQFGADADLAIAALARRPYVPSVSIKLENLVNENGCQDCQNHFFDIERYNATLAAASVSMVVPHPVGQSILGLNLPFFGPFSTFDQYKATVGYVFKLTHLEAFLSFAPTIYSFGFLFDTDGYRIGISYTDEKQDNSIAIERQKQTYVFTSFYL